MPSAKEFRGEQERPVATTSKLPKRIVMSRPQDLHLGTERVQELRISSFTTAQIILVARPDRSESPRLTPHASKRIGMSIVEAGRP